MAESNIEHQKTKYMRILKHKKIKNNVDFSQKTKQIITNHLHNKQLKYTYQQKHFIFLWFKIEIIQSICEFYNLKQFLNEYLGRRRFL